MAPDIKTKKERNMSTRSNTIIKDLDSGREIFMYRHCDGYFSGAGFDLLDFAKKMNVLSEWEDVSKLAMELEETDLGYEPTEGLHLDIEFIYLLEVQNKKIHAVREFEPRVDAKCTTCTIGNEITDELMTEYEKEGNISDLSCRKALLGSVGGSASTFIELTNVGSLKIDKISVKKSAIISVAKTENGKFGCIVQVMGEKYPVAEKYEDVLKMIAES